MHVGGIPVDLNWFLQLILTVFIIAFGLLYLVKNTASKYFEVDANFERNHQNDAAMPAIPMDPDSCAGCGQPANKKCSRCKSVRYCSSTCQSSHWNSGHKTKCKDSGRVTSTPTARNNFGGKMFSAVALVPECGTSKIIEKPREVLFPYDEFVKLFNWDKPGFLPCGLLNCGNSCFANVVLQCLVFTRPLVAYLLEKGHRRECRRNDWCFLCEFQTHVEKTSQSTLPFSPISILSRLPNIGGNLGYGRQEDAHEFMRFAIDTMQSVCLDEFGGEKAVPSSSQETTLIQHIFGGHLQSQVTCTICKNISNQYENMMDLTVEIHGDAASLEECLDQFTAKEWLHGENMYKCDRCNDYVKACKRLTIRQAPNILTIALKRFQSGRFGKLNKRVSFPETLDLNPYMSEEGDSVDVYKLYAVVVHVDMLNASFFGHYICYTKDFCGNWYRIDDSKVVSVELEEVLSQGAYMLLYSRVCARPSCLRTNQSSRKEKLKADKVAVESCEKEPNESFSSMGSLNPASSYGSLTSNSSSHSEESGCGKQSYVGINSERAREHIEDGRVVNLESNSSASMGISNGENERSFDLKDVSGHDEDLSNALSSDVARKDLEGINMVDSMPSISLLEEVRSCEKGSCEKDSCGAVDSEIVIKDSCGAVDSEIVIKDSCGAVDSEVVIKDSVDIDMVDFKSCSSVAEDMEDCSRTCLPNETSLAKTHGLKRESPVNSSDERHGNEPKRAEIIINEVCNNEGALPH